MQAIRIHNYGGADVLMLEETPTPTPKANEVLVKVQAASVNPVDWKIREGHMKDMIPIQFPATLGSDFAGVIEAVGPDVTNWQVGQSVFGSPAQGSGAYAQYAAAASQTIAEKPNNVDFAQAASLPVAALTAWQGLFDHGHLEAGQSVLIHGAAGGVGMFAVQFAKWKGATVYATAGADDLDWARELGADTVIDYKNARFEDSAKDVDLVLDLIGGETQTRSFAVIKPGGALIATAQPPAPAAGKDKHIRAEMMNMKPTTAALQQVIDLLSEGKIRTFIGATFPLAEVKQAHELSQNGHVRGKIILEIS